MPVTRRMRKNSRNLRSVRRRSYSRNRKLNRSQKMRGGRRNNKRKRSKRRSYKMRGGALMDITVNRMQLSEIQVEYFSEGTDTGFKVTADWPSNPTSYSKADVQLHQGDVISTIQNKPPNYMSSQGSPPKNLQEVWNAITADNPDLQKEAITYKIGVLKVSQ